MASQDLRPDSAVPADDADQTPDVPLRRRRRWWPRILLGAVTLVVVLALVASGLMFWSVRRAFPQYDGALKLPGLAAPVTVYRDSHGVPQVYASSETDLFKAEGYTHAQDRFWEMDFRRHVTSGRLAELFGASQVPTDAFLRTMGWRKVAEQEWRILSPATRSYLQDYAVGVNAWIAANGGSSASGAMSLEYSVLGLQNPGYKVENWDPVDSIAWLKAMAWDLRSNMTDEIERAELLGAGLSRTQIEQLFPPYPYTRNQPIVDGGVIRGGAFDTKAGPAATRTVPASYRGTDRLWRDAQPVLGALDGAMRTMSGVLGATGEGIGSNSWVVGGALTTSGKPMLANDPHLSPSLPNIWYQIGLHCTCAYNVTGYSMSGMPGILVGHNDRIAWGLTNLGADVTDLYLEKVDRNRYYDGTGWRDLISQQEVVKVAGGSPVTITVRATGHGPLLSDRSTDLLAIAERLPVDPPGSPVTQVPATPTSSFDADAPGVPPQAAASPYAVALRWTALDPGHTIDAIFAMDKATGWKDFRAAAAQFDVPAQNLVYADVDGNIGYQAPGRIPIRGKSDGRWPAPGWDPAYDWKGYIPFAQLPNVFNPPSGEIVTANQAVVGPQYPYLLTGDWEYGYRSQRIHDMIAARTAHGKLGVADMRQMQFDNYNGFAPVLVPALLATPAPAGASSTWTKARDLLKGWDFQQPAETPAKSSAAAAFYNATLRHLTLRTFDELPDSYKPSAGEASWELIRSLIATPASPWWDDKSTKQVESMTDTLNAALTDVVTELSGRLGDDPAKWRWGDLHTLTLANDTFGRSGIPPVEWLFNHTPVKLSGGGGSVNATSWLAEQGYDAYFVPSMRMIVDLSDLDGSRWVQLAGNSGHTFQDNYTDQLELWRTGRDLPMRWTRTSIQSAAKRTLTLEPARSG